MRLYSLLWGVGDSKEVDGDVDGSDAFVFKSKNSLNLNVQQLLLTVQVILTVIRTLMGAMPLCSRKIPLGQIVLPTVIPGGVQTGVRIRLDSIEQ